MRDKAGSTRKLLACFAVYRARIFAAAALLYFGVCAGRALFLRAYLADAAAYFARGAYVPPAMLPGRVLLYALLPPLCYGAAMVLSACTAWALPLWGAAVMGAGLCAGMEGAFAAALLRAGLPGGALLCVCVARTAAAGALAVYAPQARGEALDAEAARAARLFRVCIGAVLLLICAAAGVSVTGAGVVGALFD